MNGFEFTTIIVGIITSLYLIECEVHRRWNIKAAQEIKDFNRDHDNRVREHIDSIQKSNKSNKSKTTKTTSQQDQWNNLSSAEKAEMVAAMVWHNTR